MTSSKDTIDINRRRFIVKSNTVIGAIGLGIVSVPFISSMLPSARARSAGAPVEVDISKLAMNQQITIEWRGQPVWILRRGKDVIKKREQQALIQQLQDSTSTKNQQPDYAKNNYRSITPEYLIVVGICTHLGCVPTFRPELAPSDLGPLWFGGYFCPCHGSKFDLAGRVFKGVPAPTNLVIPPYHFITDTIVKIGTDNIDTV